MLWQGFFNVVQVQYIHVFEIDHAPRQLKVHAPKRCALSCTTNEVESRSEKETGRNGMIVDCI